MLDYSSVSAIKEYLEASNFAMQKKWGQNFLIDESVRLSLLEALKNVRETKIWEVGPGLGAMTYLLREGGANLTLFEIDKGFIQFLNKKFENCNNIKIVEGDVLKTWGQELKHSGVPEILFGCLPYNISISLLLDFFSHGIIFNSILVTVQKEVAQKVMARKGEASYCPLAVFSQYFYNVRKVRDIPPSAFWPQPHVLSSVLLFEKKSNVVIGVCEKLFVKLTFALFSSRRRTAKNNLLQFLKLQKNNCKNIENVDVDEIFSKLKIKANERAEDLSYDTFFEIAKSLV